MNSAARRIAAMGLAGLMAILGTWTLAFGEGSPPGVADQTNRNQQNSTSVDAKRAADLPVPNTLVPNPTPATISAERSRYFSNAAARTTQFGHDLDNRVGGSVNSISPLEFPGRDDVDGPRPGQSVASYLNARESEAKPDVGDLHWIPGASNLQQTAPVIRPFTAPWYAQHPHAWQYGYPGDTAWVMGTADRLSGWLNTTLASEGRSVAQPVAGIEGEQPLRQQPNSWMNIGVYSLAPVSSNVAERMIHLAVDSKGDVRGTHYDLISDEALHLQGHVDKNSKQIAWSVGRHGQMIFQASLDQLLGLSAPVEARFANGQTVRWTATKVQPPPNARD